MDSENVERYSHPLVVDGSPQAALTLGSHSYSVWRNPFDGRLPTLENGQ